MKIWVLFYENEGDTIVTLFDSKEGAIEGFQHKLGEIYYGNLEWADKDELDYINEKFETKFITTTKDLPFYSVSTTYMEQFLWIEEKEVQTFTKEQ